MKLIIQNASAWLVAGAIVTSGCSNLTPGENSAIAGGIVGAAVGIPLAAAGVDSSITVPVTLGAAALAAAGTYVYAKYQADQEQKRIAEARAELYLAKLEKQRQEEEAAAARAAAAGKKKPAVTQKPRYIAVETEKRSGYKGESAVMIYDTKSDKLVGNNVYDIKKPKVGTVSKYDTVQAQYVGTGS